jgi:hypothetical protein
VTPDQISGLISALQVIERIGAWPLTTILLAGLFGPWVMAFILARSQERRFEATRRMYVSNVKLVEGYQKVCENIERREQDLRSIIMMNTQAMTRLTDAIQAGR